MKNQSYDQQQPVTLKGHTCMLFTPTFSKYLLSLKNAIILLVDFNVDITEGKSQDWLLH